MAKDTPRANHHLGRYKNNFVKYAIKIEKNVQTSYFQQHFYVCCDTDTVLKLSPVNRTPNYLNVCVSSVCILFQRYYILNVNLKFCHVIIYLRKYLNVNIIWFLIRTALRNKIKLTLSNVQRRSDSVLRWLARYVFHLQHVLVIQMFCRPQTGRLAV